MLNNYYISDSGDKELTVKRDKQNISVKYHSIDSFSNISDTDVCGYVNLKRKVKKNRKIVGTLFAEKNNVSPIYEDRNRIKAIKGYVDVGQNRFIAIEKNNPLILIVPIVLFVLILLSLPFLWNNSPGKVPNRWTPTIDQNIGDINIPAEDSESQIKIAGFSSWSIPAGKTENIPINLHNPQGNPCYFSFTLVLTDTNRVIYQSAMVPPGETIRHISISEPLEIGAYKAIIHIETNEIETGCKMNSVDLNLTIVAN